MMIRFIVFALVYSTLCQSHIGFAARNCAIQAIAVAEDEQQWGKWSQVTARHEPGIGYRNLTVPERTFEFIARRRGRRIIWKDVHFIEGSPYVLVIPVSDLDEATTILESLIQRSSSLRALIPALPRRVGGGFRGPGFRAEIATSRKNQQFTELRLSFHSDLATVYAEHFYAALLESGLRPAGDVTRYIDFQEPGARRDWGFYSFLTWSKAISPEESNALQHLSSTSYAVIHRYLREGIYQPCVLCSSQNSMDLNIQYLDQAIGRGRVNRSIAVYRADARPELNAIWNRLILEAGPSTTEASIMDPAYLYSSLDPGVAIQWNQGRLLSRGIILHINVPADAHAAFVDVPNVMPDRGYLEMIFPRNTRLLPRRAYRIEALKVLEVDLIAGPNS